MDIERLDQGLTRLAGEASGLRPALQELRDWLVSSDPIERLRINPYVIAATCEAAVDDIVALALRATMAGVFDLHWLVHCPHCNMITRDCGNFFELTQSSNCKMCDVEFESDFLTRVEVTFSLNRSIEDVDAAAFCLPPPVLGSKINIAVSPNGADSGVDFIDEPGVYRFFCPITLAKGLLNVSGEPTAEIQEYKVVQLPTFNYDETSFVARPGPIKFELINNCQKVSGIFIIQNELTYELSLESLPARLTGLAVIHYPEYRAAFGDQVLSAQERLEISSVTLMFTDIAGSTALYERIGNAAAYSTVRHHFDVLFRCIEKHGGFVIKTIGDAVMASFIANDDALNCALEAMGVFVALSENHTVEDAVHVKWGIHRGSAILVNLNGRVDYFGSMVNKASRIQSVAGFDELVISSEVRADSVVADVLFRNGGDKLREEHIKLKGIVSDQAIYRIVGADGMAVAGGARADVCPCDDEPVAGVCADASDEDVRA